MEDEDADRVYVPGTSGNPAPPDRDVEPFWEPEEMEAPVHGRPVPHDAPPAVPLPHSPTPHPPNGAPGMYRPGDRIPVPPPNAVPVPPPSGQVPIPAPRPAPGPPPTQAWPNLEPQAPFAQEPFMQEPFTHEPFAPAEPPQAPAPSPVSGPAVEPEPLSPAPTSGGPESSSHESGVHSSPDSPWSQPPHRTAPTPEPQDPRPAAASAAVPVTRPETSPAPQAEPPADEEPANGAVYRPAAPPPPAHGAAAVPPQTPPPPQQPAHPPYPPQQPYPPRQMPGPYPPTMDPRAMQHPPAPVPPQPSTDPFQDLPWVSDGTPTAEEFARRRMAKPADPVATQGARAMLRKGTMGLVKLAPGKREQEFKQDVEMVRRNFGGLRQVTVVNPKGGAGKTVAVLLLAMTFGQKRGGYVLAWDNNETQGTLGMRAQQDFHARTVRDMMRDLHLFRGSHGRVGDLSQYVRAQGEGMFDVLASDESATAGEMLTADAFGEIREIVSRFYKLIFVDTGNNVRAQNWQAAMDATDQLVITMSARNDSAETAARMLDHLEQSGRQRLVRQAVSVVSMPPTRKDIDLPAIQRHFAARTRAVLLAPYEKLIDSGEPIRYGHLSSNTKDAWLKIAAAVAEGL
ncbi:chromosome partitioning protein [Actinoplanes sp. LDG1-06]|uniref:Chromosome partitioning protein n=1 Tax=Paractinoplanes ovalisporus TaxID=2810368 RepID=A0ABS2AA76_9ACTN|nr:chromosome partitioning protein [Actinoplanes ovalisporus]MBM2616749.1 chromosome partitioning protein [Actinoplanes ovalisporus]